MSPTPSSLSSRSRFLKTLREMPLFTLLSFVIILIMLIAGFGAPIFAPFSFESQDVSNIFASPSWDHWFGTDALGRDVFSRLLYGCRLSMTIALITAVSSVAIGIVVGTISGFVGGWVDKLIMRSIEIVYTLPSLIIMILVMMIVGRNVGGVIIALTITGWLGTARLMRAQVLSWKNRPFVEAARALGMPPLRLVFKHILPNCIGPIIVELSYQMPTNILAEAFLSFIGIGIAPPTPSWGVMAEEGYRALQSYPHLTLFPAFFISATMMAFTFIGDYLRDRLDPMLRGR